MASHAGRAQAPPSAPSALDAALSLVGDRWSLLVVDALLGGPRRFGQLQEAVPGIATNVLTQRLRRLGAARVIVARAYSERPPRASYELTAAGRELAGALRLLAQWAADADRAGAGRGGVGSASPTVTPTHAVCATPLQARWWCPTCDQPVDDPEDGPVLYA